MNFWEFLDRNVVIITTVVISALYMGLIALALVYE